MAKAKPIPDAGQDHTRVDRSDLYAQPHFWGVHLWEALRGAIANEDPVAEQQATGWTDAALNRFYERELTDAEHWPTFTVPLQHGYDMTCLYANLPGDIQCEYYLKHADWTAEIDIGTCGGCWRLPSLRWRELVQLAHLTRGGKRDQEAQARTLLLFLPLAWMCAGDDQQRACVDLARAIGAIPCLQAVDAEKYAECLVRRLQSRVTWRHSTKYGWINDGAESVRNPKTTWFIRREDAARVAAFWALLDAQQ